MTGKTNKQIALEIWVEKYADQLYSWAFHKTRIKETAEDLVQETFLSAFKSFENCNNKEKPKTWLFTILNNKIIDHYRKVSKSWYKASSPWEEKSEQLVDRLFDNNNNWIHKQNNVFEENEKHLLDTPEFINLLEKCLLDLPPNWRLAIISKYIYNRKGKEICKELGISPSNYWQILHRSKQLLKLCLEKYWKI